MTDTGSVNSSLDDVLEAALHPYYPLGVAIPGYVAKVLTTQEILGIFTTTCLGILIPTWLYIRHSRHDLPSSEVLTALWFVLCGFIHLGLEGKIPISVQIFPLHTCFLDRSKSRLQLTR
jgi:cholestenol delta-isomerase